MSSDSVSQIKDKLPIDELISEYIQLEKAGNNLKGCCPFHNEKTPSFFVSPDRGAYYCFGCGAKGDIFTFVQEYEGIEFKEALRVLAEKAGVSLEDYKVNSDREKYFRIMEGVTKLYQALFQKNSDAKKYLTSRGLKDSDIEKWRIGLAPDDWQTALNFLKTKKVSEKDIEVAGLIKKGEKGSYYDRFRNRIMFPIFDGSSRVIAFSGRTLSTDSKEAKYINSPDTPLFNKSEVLYGFNFAKKNIRKLDFSIIVEGQFDVIMCHQAGYTNAVATSGTSITEDHITQLQRLSKKIVIALDGDGAGLRASKKAWEIALNNSMDVKVVFLPDGKDPADLINEDPKKWKEIIKNAQHIIDFMIDILVKKEVSEPRSLLGEIKKEILPYVSNLESSMEKDYFIQKISDIFSVSTESIWSDLGDVNSSLEFVEKEVDNKVDFEKPNIIEQLFSIFLLVESTEKYDKDLLVYLKKEIVELIGDEKFNTFLESYKKRGDQMVFQSELVYKEFNSKKLRATVDEFLKAYKKTLLEKKRTYLREELKQSEKSDNSERQSELLKEIQDISSQLDVLR